MQHYITYAERIKEIINVALARKVDSLVKKSGRKTGEFEMIQYFTYHMGGRGSLPLKVWIFVLNKLSMSSSHKILFEEG